MRILFGGSFDPVHVGHILLARDVKEKMGAKEVIFMPAYRAPLKEGHNAPPEDRLNMLRLALKREEGFRVDDYEIKRKGTSYTVYTLRYLRKRFGDEELYVLLGSDSFLRFHLWKEPHEILRLARIIVVEREGKLGSVKEYLREHFPGVRIGEEVILLRTRRVDISSTEIRKRVKEGRSIYCMVPEEVERYIRERGLYR